MSAPAVGRTGSVRQEYLVDDVDDAVRLVDIGGGDGGIAAVFIGAMAAPPSTAKVSVSPETVVSVAVPPLAAARAIRSAAFRSPATACAVRTFVSVSLFSGRRSVSTVPAGSAAKASLTGAKSVKEPGLERGSVRPAATTAATSVVWSAEFIAFSTMFLPGYIAAPSRRVRNFLGAGSMGDVAPFVDVDMIFPLAGLHWTRDHGPVPDLETRGGLMPGPFPLSRDA
jgi:hypothetical protein